MTIVEFYDKNSIENIVSTLLCSPDKVIFVGDNEKRILKALMYTVGLPLKEELM